MKASAMVYIVFVPTMQSAKAGEQGRRFLLQEGMPTPNVGELVMFGDPEQQFRVVSRSFDFAAEDLSQVFFGIERAVANNPPSALKVAA